MVTMQIHYCKYDAEPDSNYVTWEWTIGPSNYMGGPYWEKLWKPKFSPFQRDEEHEWYRTSNKEDLHFTMKELRAAQEWAQEHIDVSN